MGEDLGASKKAVCAVGRAGGRVVHGSLQRGIRPDGVCVLCARIASGGSGRSVATPLRQQMRRVAGPLVASLALLACAAGSDVAGPGDMGGGQGTSSGAAGAGAGTTGSGLGPGGGSGDGGSAPAAVCTVPRGALDAAPRCGPAPDPVDGVELVEKWHYEPSPAPGWGATIVGLPLVASLTDDNADGVVDLCDVPDVVVLEEHRYCGDDIRPQRVQLVVLSGKDGAVLRTIEPGDLATMQIAIADLDQDGTPEILAVNQQAHAIALEPDGSLLWESGVEIFDRLGFFEPDPPLENELRAIYVSGSAFAVHDIDGDGSPEVLWGMTVLGADGSLVFQDPTQGAEYGLIMEGRREVRPTAADLDGDGKLEVLFGHVTYDIAGNELWRLPELAPGAHAHPADFDGDGTVEVFLTSEEGLTLVTADGEVLWGPTRLGYDDPPLYQCWSAPAAIADLDGNGSLEAIVNTCEHRMLLAIGDEGATVLRSEPVPITTVFGAPEFASTAFDFRGFGPDWMAYHQRELRVFAGSGAETLDDLAISSCEGLRYPVVVDADNDGSADVLVEQGCGDRLVVLEDAMKRPSPARRIWNQWNYAPSQVREDAIATASGDTSSLRVQARVACVEPEGPPE